LDTVGFTPGAGAPPTDTLNRGNVNGKNWIPAECDVSIRPGWFYHKEEDGKVKTPEELFQLYLKSVGRGANLLLNVPPDRRGMICEKDSAALVGFKKLRDESFKNNLINKAKLETLIIKSASEANEETDYLPINHTGTTKLQLARINFSIPQKINCIVLKENIIGGQAIERYFIQSEKMKDWISGSTIGHKRIITFPAINIDDFILNFISYKSTVLKVSIAAYLIDENLIEKK
jgi:alpha-L-fucosidase